jgi:hypothetical protein
VGQQDMGDAVGHFLDILSGEGRIIGQEGIDQDFGGFRLYPESRMAEPGDLHEKSPLLHDAKAISGPELFKAIPVGKPFRTFSGIALRT